MERQSDAKVGPSPVPRRRAPFASAMLFAAVATLAASSSGCQIVIGVMQMMQGFPKNTCDFKNFTKQDLAKEGKKVVVVSSSTGLSQVEEPSLDLKVIAELSRKLKIENIDVVDPRLVSTWIDENGEITKNTLLDPIGRHFHADYIVLINFDTFGYREENSRDLYRGHADGHVVAAEMAPSSRSWDKRRAKVIYNKPFRCNYPANQPVSVSADAGPEVFKQQFLEKLSKTLSWLFYDHRLEDEI